MIPEPSDEVGHRKRRGPRGGRPPSFDAADYRGRNDIERGFCDTKQWRGLTTRYDKLAVVDRGGAVLRAITLWLHLAQATGLGSTTRDSMVVEKLTVAVVVDVAVVPLLSVTTSLVV